MSYADTLLPEFDHEMANTRKVLERVPDDKLDWQPHPKSHTIGWNANHLANIPDWLVHAHWAVLGWTFIHSDYFAGQKGDCWFASHGSWNAVPPVGAVVQHVMFDRVTGKPIWPIEEKPVPQTDVPGEKTSPTQPIPTAPPPFARQSFTLKDINPYISEAEQAMMREELQTYRNEGLFTPPSRRGTPTRHGSGRGCSGRG